MNQEKERPKIQVKVLAAQTLVDELAEQAEANPTAVQIISKGTEKDPTALEFELGDVANIIALVEGAIIAGEWGYRLYKWISANKNRRVVIQTPTRRIQLHYSEGMTEEEVRTALQQLISTV
ncbi:MAG: hypothetical protein IPK82_00215 [Polyangiaceae bacterium]|nr:hypothetical protein [Polyangiaceae bacterium]